MPIRQGLHNADFHESRKSWTALYATCCTKFHQSRVIGVESVDVRSLSQSTFFTVPIFANFSITRESFINNSYTEFYPNMLRSVSSRANIPPRLYVTYGLHCADFYKTRNCPTVLGGDSVCRILQNRSINMQIAGRSLSAFHETFDYSTPLCKEVL
jgi:hypothetical protein